MPTEKFANNAITTLNGGINNAVSSLVVTSASLFPSVGQFRIRIDNEIMIVTAVAGTTFTVTRGAEGTSAASHSDGATIRHIVTAGGLSQAIADASGWITALDVDFVAEATQTLATDGTYTIGGLSWVKSNSANEAASMTVTNGSGLIIQPSSSTDIGGATRSAPMIRFVLSDLGYTGLNYSSKVRLWFYNSTDTIASDYQNVFGIVDDGSTVREYAALRGRVGAGTNGLLQRNVISSANTDLALTLAHASTNRVIMMELDALQAVNVRMFYGSFGSTWPDVKDLNLMGKNAAITAATTLGSGTKGNTLGISLGASRAGGAALTATIARVRLDVSL